MVRSTFPTSSALSSGTALPADRHMGKMLVQQQGQVVLKSRSQAAARECCGGELVSLDVQPQSSGPPEKRFSSCTISLLEVVMVLAILASFSQATKAYGCKKKAETSERKTKVLQGEHPLEIFLLFHMRQIKSGQL